MESNELRRAPGGLNWLPLPSPAPLELLLDSLSEDGFNGAGRP